MSESFAVWARRMRRESSGGMALVCFPAGGGAAGDYRLLARHIRPGADVYAIQYPGRRDRIREPRIESLTEMAELVTAALEPLFGGDVALFGHSMGATVAFEVARRMRARGARPAALFVSGRSAPDESRIEPLTDIGDAALIAELERLADDPASVAVLRTEPEIAAAVLPAVRSDYLALERYLYRPGEPLDCPVVGLTGADDPVVTPAQVRRWRAHTTGPFALHVFPGRHFYLNSAAPAVARVVDHHLEPRVHAGVTPPNTQ